MAAPAAPERSWHGAALIQLSKTPEMSTQESRRALRQMRKAMELRAEQSLHILAACKNSLTSMSSVWGLSLTAFRSVSIFSTASFTSQLRNLGLTTESTRISSASGTFVLGTSMLYAICKVLLDRSESMFDGCHFLGVGMSRPDRGSSEALCKDQGGSGFLQLPRQAAKPLAGDEQMPSRRVTAILACEGGAWPC